MKENFYFGFRGRITNIRPYPNKTVMKLIGYLPKEDREINELPPDIECEISTELIDKYNLNIKEDDIIQVEGNFSTRCWVSQLGKEKQNTYNVVTSVLEYKVKTNCEIA